MRFGFLLNFGHLECFHQDLNASVIALDLTAVLGTPSKTTTRTKTSFLMTMTLFGLSLVDTSKSFHGA